MHDTCGCGEMDGTRGARRDADGDGDEENDERVGKYVDGITYTTFRISEKAGGHQFCNAKTGVGREAKSLTRRNGRESDEQRQSLAAVGEWEDKLTHSSGTCSITER